MKSRLSFSSALMFSLSVSSILQLLYGTLLAQTYAHIIDKGSGTGMGLLRNGNGGDAVARGHVPLDVEGYPAAPPGLELQQVHIYVRHGTSCFPSRARRVYISPFG